MAKIEFIFDERLKQVSLRLPIDESLITRRDVLAELNVAGYGNYFIHEKELTDAIAQRSAAKKPPASPKNDEIRHTNPVVIAESRNAEAQLQLTADRMTASLTIFTAFGGNPISSAQCVAALESQRVSHGIDKSAIKELMQQSMNAPPGTQLSNVIARGMPAQNGEDSRFEALVPTVKDRVLTPKQRDDGSTDYHELGAIPTVSVGTPLIRRIPPTAGKNGVTVTGETLFAFAGKALPFTILPGAQISPTDPNMLIAAIDGIPVMIDKGMSVEKAFRVVRVDAASGNVTYEGGVIVAGDVASGFSVRAAGNISIAGVVESARVIAGNDVSVNTGVTGCMSVKNITPTAFITAGHMLWVNFAQFAELHANVGVVAEKLLLHCKITSLDWVKLGGDRASSSKLIGGELRAVNFIKVDTLGDPNEVKTVVELTGNFAAYKKERHEIHQEITTKERQLDELEVLADKVKRKTGIGDPGEVGRRIEATTARVSEELNELRQRMVALEEKQRTHSMNVRLVITRRAYPGCEITIGDRRVVLQEEWGPGTIRYGTEGLIFNIGEVKLPTPRKKKAESSPPLDPGQEKGQA